MIFTFHKDDALADICGIFASDQTPGVVEFRLWIPDILTSFSVILLLKLLLTKERHKNNESIMSKTYQVMRSVF